MQCENNKSPILFDGAFGTYYGDGECELANLYDKQTVVRIHREYIKAGVSAIKTNTYAAGFTPEEKAGQWAEIIKNGYMLAMEAAGEQAKVFADIGYIGTGKSDTSEGEPGISNRYLEEADVFIECGAKNFLFETLCELDSPLPAIRHIKSRVPDAFIIASFAVSQDGYTQTGHYYKKLIEQALCEESISMAGLNCVCGPTHLYNLVKKLDVDRQSLCIMPNAGYPSNIGGRTVFRDNAEYFSQKLADINALGVGAIGGCCGTTPEHIRMAIDKILLRAGKDTQLERPHVVATHERRANHFETGLNSGKVMIAVELDPPVDTDCTHLMSAAKLVQDAGADMITLADSPLARTRADSIMAAAKLKRELGIETLPHLSCRDKNHIGIKASLIGASIEHISNVLVVTGDPVVQSERTGGRGVFSFHSASLIAFISSLNAQVFSDAPFYIGAALNVNAPQFEAEMNRAEKKLRNGAGFLLTQPIFSEQGIQNLKLAKQRLGGKILAGILPVASYKNALFLNNEVAGIEIPDSIIEALKGKEAKDAKNVSLDFSKKIIDSCAGVADGFYLMTPLKKVDFVCELIEYIRKISD